MTALVPELPTTVTVSLHGTNYTWASGIGHLPEIYTTDDIWLALGEAIGHFLRNAQDAPTPSLVARAHIPSQEQA